MRFGGRGSSGIRRVRELRQLLMGSNMPAWFRLHGTGMA